MKKRKIFTTIAILVITSFLLVGCGKKEEENNKKQESTTVASTLVNQFKEEIKKEADIEKVANKIKGNEILEIATNVAEIGKEDYITGVTTEVKDFNKAVTIRPMIGSIPFIAYIFETDNAKDLASTLKENADPRWNICTEADEVETEIYENYVFFIMAPKNFEEE